MRTIALQSSVGGLLFAATGHLAPVDGAVMREAINMFAILNALPAAFPPKVLGEIDADGRDPVPLGNAHVPVSV